MLYALILLLAIFLVVLYYLTFSEDALKASQGELATAAGEQLKFPCMIYNHATWCRFCVESMPRWRDAALLTPDIPFYEVEASEPLAGLLPPVDTYPTIRYHYSVDRYETYTGDRSVASISAFAKAVNTGGIPDPDAIYLIPQKRIGTAVPVEQGSTKTLKVHKRSGNGAGYANIGTPWMQLTSTMSKKQ